MLEGHIVARAPRELSAEAGVHTVLNVILRCDVSNLLVSGLKCLHSRVEFVILEHGKLLNVSDVTHSLKLVQMLSIVHEVKHKVVLHGNIEGLHLFSLSTSSGDSRVNTVLRIHETSVLVLDLVDNIRGVNIGAVGIPVDCLSLATSGSSVVIVEQTGELCVLVASTFISSTSTDTLEPVAREILSPGSLVVAAKH